MSDTLEFRKVKPKVFSALKECEYARDDDKLLLIQIWLKESKAKDVAGLFIEILDGTLSHFESVRRMRQKIQEKHPALRGEKWESRHRMEAAVCEQLDIFDTW